MNNDFPDLIGKAITLVCFGEYVCFVHFDEGNHIRLESEAWVVGQERFQLFPSISGDAVSSILGKTVISAIATPSGSLEVSLSDNIAISCRITGGYESIMVSIGGRETVF